MNRRLRVEPIRQPDDGSEYGILDSRHNELAVVYGGRKLANLFAASPRMKVELQAVRADLKKALRRVERALASLNKPTRRSR